jgi:hypothetical protein
MPLTLSISLTISVSHLSHTVQNTLTNIRSDPHDTLLSLLRLSLTLLRLSLTLLRLSLTLLRLSPFSPLRLLLTTLSLSLASLIHHSLTSLTTHSLLRLLLLTSLYLSISHTHSQTPSFLSLASHSLLRLSFLSLASHTHHSLSLASLSHSLFCLLLTLFRLSLFHPLSHSLRLSLSLLVGLKTMLLMDRYASHSVHFSVSRSLSLISQTQGKRQSGTCHSMVDHDFPYKEVRL